MSIDFNILYFFQSIRTDWLDNIVVFFTNACGKNGEIWLVLGAVLLLFKKTRKMGLAVLLSYLLSWIVCQDILKDLICRSRPCHIDETIKLLVKRPTSYSCPSTHTTLAFAMAMAVKSFSKKAGIFAFAVSFFVAFTRMYLFVHFPSDVLLGAIIGVLMGLVSALIIRRIEKL